MIGADQALVPDGPLDTTQTVVGPGERTSVVFDFGPYKNKRIITMANIESDKPFSGELPPHVFSGTDRVVAFDVTKKLDKEVSEPILLDRVD
jgi:FtsP/CotA-like multicopper oxidase with cupredoxin domain